MALIKGTTITLKERTASGTDGFGNPIYTVTTSTVNNVLIIVASAPETVSADRMRGRKQVVNIGIPKGDNHNWIDADVIWNGRTYRQFGDILEGISEMIPLEWDRTTQGELYE